MPGREQRAGAVRLVDDMLAQGEKAIVFTNYQAVVDALMAHFGEKAVKLTKN